MTTTTSVHEHDSTRGTVRAEDVYDTDIDDLWQACTSPERLARWIAEVTGDLREGGNVQVVMTSSFAGTLRIEVCEAPRHLLLTAEPGADDETKMEAWLTAEGSQTRLVVEERGIAADTLPFYGAGWQSHLEDLATALASDDPVHPDGWSAERPAASWHARWEQAVPSFRASAERRDG